MTEPTTPVPATAAWVRYALIGSVALNLLVAGLVGGAFLRGPGGGHMTGGPEGDGFRALAWAMPQDHRRDMGRELLSRREEFSQARGQMQAARASLAAALTAEPFDMAAVEAAFASQRATLLHVADEGYKAVLGRISRMSPEERAEYAENLRGKSRH